MDLDPQKRIGGVLASVQRVHASLRRPDVASSVLARDLRDEIEVFMRTPAAAITA